MLTITAILAAARTPRALPAAGAPALARVALGTAARHCDVTGHTPSGLLTVSFRGEGGSPMTATIAPADLLCLTCGEAWEVPCSCTGREAVKVLCAKVTDEQLREYIRQADARATHDVRSRAVLAYHARAALETERDRRSLAALEPS